MALTPQTQEETATYAPKGNHTLQIDRRRHTTITGVTDVCSFQETEIVLKLDGGVMVLSGQSFHIAKLLLEEGRLDVEGHVDSVVYETPKKSLKLSWPWFRRKA
ncbi:MAG: YabP/YqfC family sporulation protein [Eubacteriales bacterium]|nr:YabP/YqfC family sporulation protein [Eubacteriales bacterium]